MDYDQTYYAPILRILRRGILRSLRDDTSAAAAEERAEVEALLEGDTEEQAAPWRPLSVLSDSRSTGIALASAAVPSRPRAHGLHQLDQHLVRLGTDDAAPLRRRRWGRR